MLKLCAAIMFLAVTFHVGLVLAETAAIENESLRVLVNSADDSFAIQDVGTARSFVKRAVFPKKTEGAEVRSCEHPVWGKGHSIRVLHAGGWSTDLVVYSASPFVHVSTTVLNKTEAPYEVNSLDYLKLQVDLGVPQESLRVLGTGGLTTVSDSQGSYAFSAIANPETRNGVVCGWLTHDRGVGVFFASNNAGQTEVRAQIDFGHFQVDPGKSRPTETLLIGYFDDARVGLEAYTDSIVRHYDIKLAESPGVYCTWYHAGASDEQRVATNAKFAAEHLKPFGLNVIQIDDKWQAILPRGFKHDGKIQKTGPIKVFVDTQGNYPRGMAYTAERIASFGMVPGIWFMPFAGNFRNPYFDPGIFAKNPDGTPFHDARWSGTCLDLSNPKTQAFLRERVKRIYDWGYRYFKIDGMHTGLVTYNIYVNTGYRNADFGKGKLHDPSMTHVEAYRKGLEILREQSPGTFILGCNVSQNMRSMGPAFGMIDGMRIGPDNGGAAGGNWGAVTKGAWHGTNLYFLNGRVWHNDPDPVYARPSNPIERARWMCSWLAVAGAMHTSSEQYGDLPAERLDLLKRCLPSHNCVARPVDLLETNTPGIWLAQNERLHIVGLFNWSDKDPAEIVYDMGKLGLDRETTYVAFDYWANEFSGPIQGTLEQTLPPGTCRILAVRPQTEHPQLLSTSRHITQGLIDVLEENWDSGTKTLSGKSQVVGGDPYELRIALPPRGSWKAARVHAEGVTAKIGDATDKGVRVLIESPSCREVAWRVVF